LICDEEEQIQEQGKRARALVSITKSETDTTPSGTIFLEYSTLCCISAVNFKSVLLRDSDKRSTMFFLFEIQVENLI
jgi:hypothetical protein